MRSYARFLALIGAAGLLVGTPARADTLSSGDPATLLAASDYVTGLTDPTGFAFLPDGRMVITQKGGTAVIRQLDGSVQDIGTFPVDSSSEKGLLNVAVHPDFATNHLLFFYYSLANSSGGSNANRHRVVSIPLGSSDQLDMASQTVLVSGLRGPANHDGGALAVGPDGKLYIGVGDTGCNSNQAPEPPYTPTNYFGTCLTYGNGHILRVNLDGSIPADNPLVNVAQVSACGGGNSCGTAEAIDPTTLPLAAPRKDIWAWGFRNPWRFSFDPRTGYLWVGDVGEVTYEEIDVIPPSGAGKHYGWPYREGQAGHPKSICQTITPNVGDCVDPVYYCTRDGMNNGVQEGCQAITGGVIVDSCDWPSQFRGLYFFGDNVYNTLFTIAPNTARDGVVPNSRQDLGFANGAPVSFGVGPDGALYYSVIAGGTSSYIERIAPQSSIVCPTPDGGAGTAGASGHGGASGASGTAGTDASAGAAGTGTGGTGTGGTGTGGTGTGGTGAAGTGGVGGSGGASASGGTGGCCAGSGGTTTDGGAGKSSSSGDSGGCGCRVGADPANASAAWLASALLGLLLSRRRRG